MKNLMRLILALTLVGSASTANALIIGTGSSGNTFPFGSTGWLPNYQQVYDASAFSGPIGINSLSFYHTIFDTGNDTPTAGIFTIMLSTTSAPVDGLGAFNANLGIDNAVVFSGALPTSVPFGSQMDIILSSIFNYDPSQGNLLLSINAPGASQPAGQMAFDIATSSTDSMSRLRQVGNTDSGGLVTGFNEASINIPEPTTLALLGLGVAGIGFSRKKSTQA